MVDAAGWAALALAWLGTWLGDRQPGLLQSECLCNCTCEVATSSCPTASSWSWEILKVGVYILVGVFVGTGHLLGLAGKGIGHFLQWALQANTSASPGTTTLAPESAPLVDVDPPEGQRDRARQQLEALRLRRAIRA